MSDILNKLKQLRQKLELQKSDELRKEVIREVGGTQDKVHGWISPSGDYHKMPPKENHFHAIERLGYKGQDDPIEGAYKDGWLSVGHAGLQNIRGHSKYLSDPSHPAVQTSRRLVGEHLFGNVSIWHMDKQQGGVSGARSIDDVDAHHWSKHGTIPVKGGVAEFHKGINLFNMNPHRNAFGWISPKGEYHQFDDDNDSHLDWIQEKGFTSADEARNGGWVSIGHGGGANVQGHSSTLNNPSHPATKTARQLVADNFHEDLVEVHHSDTNKFHQITPSSFSKYGSRAHTSYIAQFRKSDAKLHLEHYSDKQLDIIDPSMHGTGVPGEEKKYIGDVNYQPRSYHYIAGSKPELLLGSKKYKHTSSVDSSKVYDIDTDTHNLYDKAKANSPYAKGVHHPPTFERHIKDAGYHGYKSGNVVAMFESVKPHKAEENVRKSLDLRKEVYPGGQSEAHGWINPKGKYYRLNSFDNHREWINTEHHTSPEEAYKKGWVVIGVAGESNVGGHSSILSNSNHPAVRTARRLANDHFVTHRLDVVHYDTAAVHNVSVSHWSKHGTIPPKGSVAEFHKSEEGLPQAWATPKGKINSNEYDQPNKWSSGSFHEAFGLMHPHPKTGTLHSIDDTHVAHHLGYIGIGHAGHMSISGATEHVFNPSHPANIAARQYLKEHAPANTTHVEITHAPLHNIKTVYTEDEAPPEDNEDFPANRVCDAQSGSGDYEGYCKRMNEINTSYKTERIPIDHYIKHGTQQTMMGELLGKSAKEPLLPHKYSIITAESPRFEAKDKGGNKALEGELKSKGYKYELITGKYDESGKVENGFLIHHADPAHVNQLGEKYGQESVIHSESNVHKMHYTNGPKAGQHHKGEGITIHDKEPKNYYSTVTRGGKKTHFTLNFDFDKLHKTELRKEMYDVEGKVDTMKDLHGVITLDGKWHPLDPMAGHVSWLKNNKLDEQGGVAVAVGGQYAVHGPSDILGNPNHPATKMLSQKIKEHKGNFENLEVHHLRRHSQDAEIYNVPRHFAELGNFRPSTIALFHHNKLHKTDPILDKLALLKGAMQRLAPSSLKKETVKVKTEAHHTIPFAVKPGTKKRLSADEKIRRINFHLDNMFSSGGTSTLKDITPKEHKEAHGIKVTVVKSDRDWRNDMKRHGDYYLEHYKDKDGNHSVTAYDNNLMSVGRADFVHSLIPNKEDTHLESHPTKMKAWDVHVDPNHRRKGIATAMYRYAEEKSGKQIEPGDFVTPEGKEFRGSIKKNTDEYTTRPDPTVSSGIRSIYAYHKGKKIGHIFYTDDSDSNGWHNVRNANVETEHRRKGVYTKLLHAAKEEVQSRGSKGLKSQGYQRSSSSSKVWEKIHTDKIEHKPIYPEYPDIDYFLKNTDLQKMSLAFDHKRDKKPHTTVWRMEDKEGYGPYHHPKISAMDWQGKSSPNRSPAPEDDPGFSHSEVAHNPSEKEMTAYLQDKNKLGPMPVPVPYKGKKFGFSSPEQANKWFTPTETKKLKTLGFELRPKKAKKVWAGTHQVYYEPHEDEIKKAKPVDKNQMPLDFAIKPDSDVTDADLSNQLFNREITARERISALSHPKINEFHLQQVIDHAKHGIDNVTEAALNHPKINENHLQQFIDQQSKGSGYGSLDSYNILSKHPKLDEKHISSAIGESDNLSMFDALMNSPKFNASHIQETVNNGSADQKKHLLLHPTQSTKLNAEHLHSLLSTPHEKYGGHDISRLVFEHPEHNSSHVEAAMNSADFNRRWYAMGSPMATDEQLMRGTKDTEDSVRARVMGNPMVKPEHVASILRLDKDPGRTELQDEEIMGLISSKASTPQDIEKMWNHPGFQKERYAHPAAMDKLFSNPKTPEHIVDWARNSKYNADRMAALRHPSTTEQHLMNELRGSGQPGGNILEPNTLPYESAIEALKHPKINHEHIKVALDSPMQGIRRTAVQHPLATLEDAQGLLDDKAEAVRDAAKKKIGNDNPDVIYDKSVTYKPNTEIYRQYRKAVDEKGPIHKRDFQQHGITQEHVSHLLDHEGKLTSEKLSHHIDSAPSNRFNVSNATWMGGQRHGKDPSHVTQFNLTTDQVGKLKAAGAYDTFTKIQKLSHYSAHPVTDHTIGWVRSTSGAHYNIDPYATHIDEIQSDFGRKLSDIARAQAKHAQAKGEITSERASQAVTNAQNDYPDEHLKSIQNIVFGSQKPTHALHEAFHQVLRDSGRVGEKIHINSPGLKAEIANMDLGGEKELPVHIKETYGKQPAKMGYGSGKYGQLETQNGSQYEGKPTMATVLAKIHKLKDFVSETINEFRKADFEKSIADKLEKLRKALK